MASKGNADTAGKDVEGDAGTRANNGVNQLQSFGRVRIARFENALMGDQSSKWVLKAYNGIGL